MKFQTNLQISACALAALLLVGCGSTGGSTGAMQNQQAAANSAAQAAAATQAAREAQEAADKAEQERQQRIADANQNARAAKFVAQTFTSQTGSSRTILLKFQKNGRVTWDETAENSDPVSHNGKWSIKGKQLRLSFYNKETKGTETAVFEPKQALLSPNENDADCKAMSGLLPVELNGDKEGLNNFYFWPQSQVTRHNGTCLTEAASKK